MGSISEREIGLLSSGTPYTLQNFKLYETRTNFYLVGYDEIKNSYRVLKIGRKNPSELDLYEDPAVYSGAECYQLLQRIDDGNRSIGGRQFVTECYGVVGIKKLHDVYHMILITKRRKIGEICGHAIYGISKWREIPIPHPSIQSKTQSDVRCKKQLCTIDLTKDFYFSYSYPLMNSLQKNITNYQTGQISYESIFVWNKVCSQEIQERLQNALWTVPLVHGFFKQVDLVYAGKPFGVVIISRRSHKHAGTRYLTRGVNCEGQAANDVETEQIVCVDERVTSVLQNRGSIPIKWSQQASLLNMKPDILLSEGNNLYAVTQLHFENLKIRYGGPIYILNLVKRFEKKPRESILHREFTEAVKSIKTNSSIGKFLEFFSLDLDGNFQREGTLVLADLYDVAVFVLDHIGYFDCQIPQNIVSMDSVNLSCLRPVRNQNGILRANCVDCLDRTNVAQNMYGLAAFGLQLHALGIIGSPHLGFDGLLAYLLMRLYEEMGDAIAKQYGGSGAHNKIICEYRGECKAAIQLQESIKVLQRCYNNVFMDVWKQKAIDLFLGVPPLEIDGDTSCVGAIPSTDLEVTSRFESGLSTDDEEDLHCGIVHSYLLDDFEDVMGTNDNSVFRDFSEVHNMTDVEPPMNEAAVVFSTAIPSIS